MLDLNTLEYRAQQKARFESLSAGKSLTDVAERIRSVLSGQDRAAELAWKATALLFFRIRRAASDRAAKSMATRTTRPSPTICAKSIARCAGVRLGNGPVRDVGRRRCEGKRRANGTKRHPSGPVGVQHAERGPQFVLTRRAGSKHYFDLSAKAEVAVPKSPRELSRRSFVAGSCHRQNDGARLIDLHDDVYALEFLTKMNSIDADVIGLLNKAIEICDVRKKPWSSPTKPPIRFRLART